MLLLVGQPLLFLHKCWLQGMSLKSSEVKPTTVPPAAFRIIARIDGAIKKSIFVMEEYGVGKTIVLCILSRVGMMRTTTRLIILIIIISYYYYDE